MMNPHAEEAHGSNGEEEDDDDDDATTTTMQCVCIIIIILDMIIIIVTITFIIMIVIIRGSRLRSAAAVCSHCLPFAHGQPHNHGTCSSLSPNGYGVSHPGTTTWSL